MRRIAVVLAAMVLLVGGWLVLTSRTQTQNQRTERSTQAESSRTTLKPAQNQPSEVVQQKTNEIQGAAQSLAAVTSAAPAGNPDPAAARQGQPENALSETALQQIQSLEEEKRGRSAVENKIDSQLLYAGKMSRGEPLAKGVKTLEVTLDRDDAGRVMIDMKANVSKELLRHIEDKGGRVINSFEQYQSIRAAVPLNEIEPLCARTDVLFVGPAVRAERNSGSVTSEGDIALKADVARARFNATGAGVKVAVLSDSVDHLAESQGSGDLGQVTVLEGQSGVPATGEGTAMLEIVHDLAPDAILYYATAFGGDAAFANNIRQLRAAGCDIIIDDVGYFSESPFQDGIIAQAVNEVTADGALYFSSAGNAGNKDDGQSGVWEGDFADGGQIPSPITGQGRVHSFGPANYNSVITGGSSRRVDLFWTDPLGGASNDYDLYVLDSTGANVVAASSNTQNGTQNPYEALNKVEVGQRLVVVQYSGAGRFLHLSTGRGRLATSTGGQTKGHNSAVNAFCVAAVSAANATTPFTTAAKVETFSSDGPRRIFFNADGSAITPGNFSASGGILRQKPDIAAADGVATTLPADSGLNPFYGTSAAAPHAGAIAALLKSLRPGMTTSEMRAALTTGTLDIETAGTDRSAGFGLVMADLVLAAGAASSPPTITGFSPGNGAVGTTVTINGTKLTATSAVTFNGVNAMFTVVSATQLTATVPPGATTGQIRVTTPDGTAVSVNNFVVSLMPVITTFVPASGSLGTVVTITGANLNGATAVNFGGTAATTFAVNSASQITAAVPAGTTTGKITITTPLGTAQSAGVFTITVGPVVTGFDPGGGPVGSSVTISGANFVNVTAVKFNGVASANPTIISAARIVAVVPAGASTGPVSVETANGNAQSAANFAVIPLPVITSFTPASGPAGTILTINGTGFSGATAVTFNGVNAALFNVDSATKITATSPAGATTGPIRVTTAAATATSATSFDVPAAPANDNFAASASISGTSGRVLGNTVAATKEPGEPSHAGNAGGKSVWYRWIAPGSGTWTFDTIGSTFDTLLAVYTGTSLNNLTAVAYNDDIVNQVSTNSSVAFVASAGVTYLIAVDGYTAGAQATTPTASGDVILNWRSSASVPAITGFTPATAPVGASITLTGANFTDVNSVKFNGVPAVFVVNSAGQITATVPAGATSGAVAVSSPGGTAVSAGTFTVQNVANNDDFANSFVITGDEGITTASNVAATREPGEPAHAGNQGGRSIWFSWTAPADGTWVFHTAGSSFDTLLAVYTGSAVGNLTEVASNDDWNGARTSQVVLKTIAQTRYRIAVDGYAGDSGEVVLNWNVAPNAPSITGFTPSSGGLGAAVVINGVNLNGTIGVKFNGVSTSLFTNVSPTQITASVPQGASTGPITVTTSNGVAQSAGAFVVVSPAPGNDSFARRFTVTSATVAGSNQGATKEAGEPNHGGNPGASSVWWTWTAPANGTYVVTTRGSEFDTVLAVYTGTSIGGLTLVGQNDDGQNMETASQVTFNATAGTAYQLAVDGFDGATGEILLSVYPTTAAEDIYHSGFDAPEGYNTTGNLAGQRGWTVNGPGENGVVSNFFGDLSQQAYLGFSSSTDGANTFLWHDLNYTPNTNTRPVVTFSTYMEIVDSTNFRFDDFGWDFYNRNGAELFDLDFDNSNLNIYYGLNDGSGYRNSGVTFQNGRVYYLEVSMDFARNRWSATLDGEAVVEGEPISADKNVALDLGDIDASWWQRASAGDNYMIFDEYSVRSSPPQTPRVITAPQNQSVTVGGSARFFVVVDCAIPVTYQWQVNGQNIDGATSPILALENLAISQAGNYSVLITSSAGAVTSGPAALSVLQLANLTPYRPTGWSDAIVAANVPATNTATSTITSDQDVYVSWAVINDVGNVSINSRFYTQLYVDGALNHTWFWDSLQPRFFTFVQGYDLGRLSPGTHTLRIDTDATSVIPETDESDNTYTKAILVTGTAGTAPQLGAGMMLPGGAFQFTLQGTPNRAYDIQVSTNLADWSVLRTLVLSNSSATILVSDPGATNFTRRYYRGRLMP